jgi:hypothetical protein
MNLDMAPLIRDVDTGKDLEQGRFPGSIAANDPEELALLDLEADVIEGSARLALIALMQLHETLAESSPALLRKAKGLGKITDGNGGRHSE